MTRLRFLPLHQYLTGGALLMLAMKLIGVGS